MVDPHGMDAEMSADGVGAKSVARWEDDENSNTSVGCAVRTSTSTGTSLDTNMNGVERGACVHAMPSGSVEKEHSGAGEAGRWDMRGGGGGGRGDGEGIDSTPATPTTTTTTAPHDPTATERLVPLYEPQPQTLLNHDWTMNTDAGQARRGGMQYDGRDAGPYRPDTHEALRGISKPRPHTPPTNINTPTNNDTTLTHTIEPSFTTTLDTEPDVGRDGAATQLQQSLDTHDTNERKTTTPPPTHDMNVNAEEEEEGGDDVTTLRSGCESLTRDENVRRTGSDCHDVGRSGNNEGHGAGNESGLAAAEPEDTGLRMRAGPLLDTRTSVGVPPVVTTCAVYPAANLFCIGNGAERSDGQIRVEPPVDGYIDPTPPAANATTTTTTSRLVPSPPTDPGSPHPQNQGFHYGGEMKMMDVMGVDRDEDIGREGWVDVQWEERGAGEGGELGLPPPPPHSAAAAGHSQRCTSLTLNPPLQQHNRDLDDRGYELDGDADPRGERVGDDTLGGGEVNGLTTPVVGGEGSPAAALVNEVRAVHNANASPAARQGDPEREQNGGNVDDVPPRMVHPGNEPSDAHVLVIALRPVEDGHASAAAAQRSDPIREHDRNTIDHVSRQTDLGGDDPWEEGERQRVVHREGDATMDALRTVYDVAVTRSVAGDPASMDPETLRRQVAEPDFCAKDEARECEGEVGFDVGDDDVVIVRGAGPTGQTLAMPVEVVDLTWDSDDRGGPARQGALGIRDQRTHCQASVSGDVSLGAGSGKAEKVDALPEPVLASEARNTVVGLGTDTDADAIRAGEIAPSAAQIQLPGPAGLERGVVYGEDDTTGMEGSATYFRGDVRGVVGAVSGDDILISALYGGESLYGEETDPRDLESFPADADMRDADRIEAAGHVSARVLLGREVADGSLYAEETSPEPSLMSANTGTDGEDAAMEMQMGDGLGQGDLMEGVRVDGAGERVAVDTYLAILGGESREARMTGTDELKMGDVVQGENISVDTFHSLRPRMPRAVKQPESSAHYAAEMQLMEQRIYGHSPSPSPYVPPETALAELAVIDGEDAGDLKRNELPERELTEFVFYDPSHRMIDVAAMDYDHIKCYVSGSAKPRLKEGGTLSGPSTQMRFTALEWGLWHVESGHPVVWLRSKYAWYYLDRPAKEYEEMYYAFLRKITVIARVIKSMTLFPDTTYEEFLKYVAESMDDDVDVSALHKMVEENIHEIVFEVDAWFTTQCFVDGADETPLCVALDEIQGKQPGDWKGGIPHFKRTKTSNDRVLQDRNISTVTPLVARVARGFFRENIDVAGSDVEEADDDDNVEYSCTEPVIVQPPRNAETKEVRWNSEVISKASVHHKTRFIVREYYASVLIDGIEYRPGDYIFIRPYADEDNNNNDSNTTEPWFAQIRYLYQEKGTQKAHIRWLTHGKQTVLNETASYNELMFLDTCQDTQLGAVAGKPQVRYLGPEEDEPSGKSETFFYRFVYDPETGACVDAPVDSEAVDHPWGGEVEACRSCQRQERMRTSGMSVWKQELEERVMRSHGVEYKIGDFVYVVNEMDEKPYRLGQIVQFIEDAPSIEQFRRKQQVRRGGDDDDVEDDEARGVDVRVRLFCRYNDVLLDLDDEERDGVHALDTPRDDRRVYVTDAFTTVAPELLEGLCWIQHAATIADLDTYKDEDDQFWFEEKMTFRRKVRGEGRYSFEPVGRDYIKGRKDRRRERKVQLSKRREFVKSPKKLVALDLFAGAGGLTEGFDRLDFVETKYAVEFSSSAGTTFKHNFPNSQVYILCANTLLARAIDIQERGKTLPPIRDQAGEWMAELPPKGSIDFIYCGPSCQGYSGLNRFKKANDIKNTLVVTSLSYVDFYRPTYFLLENVRGLVDFRLGGVQDGRHKIKGGIEQGVVKLILKTLHAMNYQTRFGLLQAGNHGVPQSRTRFFVWAAKRGHTLPDLPQPSHGCYHTGGLHVKLQDLYGKEVAFNPVTRSRKNTPLPPVSIWDAISDLPAFEFRHPSKSAMRRTIARIEDDEDEEVPTFKVVPGQGPVGHPVQDYDKPPLSEFQRQLRRKSTVCSNHVTSTYGAHITERICSLPREPGATYRDLPPHLIPSGYIEKGMKGSYGRVNYDRQFATILTSLPHPSGKFGTCLHPEQNRVLTVREMARAQGFPDHFVFRADRRAGKSAQQENLQDMYRQIGNAVPPPLAAALGKKLLQAVLKDADLPDVSPSPSPSPSPALMPQTRLPPQPPTITLPAAAAPPHGLHHPRPTVIVEIPVRTPTLTRPSLHSQSPPPPLRRMQTHQPTGITPRPTDKKRKPANFEIVIEVKKRRREI
ncbi:hypothetical protein DFJ77DRAFT_46145 [Powellomyces hirtus]|nr:hypothetical protein DFJ77DRAFT_46145 [Powellomyces hirtus]